MEDRPLVLVIDDSSVNLMMLGGILSKEGFRTLTAPSGPEGRNLARENSVDLILLDVIMPDENGFETCRLLKEDPRTNQIPIIFISALEDVETKVKGLTIGGVDYISKPFEKAEILARTRLHIRLNRAYRTVIREQRERLQMIKAAQENLLVRPEDRPEANFQILFQPIHEAGGDFYEVLSISQGIHGYFLADVSGHDVGTSLATSALKVALQQNSSPLFTPLETLSILNELMIPIFRNGQYMTACYAHLNRNRFVLSYISAGHPPAIFVPREGPPVILESTGDVIGIFPQVHMEVKEVLVSPGDRFYLYSDGLIEGFQLKRIQRSEGVRRLMAILEAHRRKSLPEVIQAVKWEIFPEGTPPEDDLVLMGVEV